MVTRIIFIIAYLVLAPIIGCILAGLDRKMSARMQRRVGPPILQPYYDVRKLFEKEKQAPTRFQDFYIIAYLIFLIGAGAIFFGGGDLLLVIFTETIGAVFLIVAAYSSNSPYAEVGAERELLQMMAYMYHGSFTVNDLVSADNMAFLPMIGIFFGFIYILTIKFRKSPFDLSMSHHAHQELVRGVTTEFVGRTMGWIEISHWFENIFILGFIFLFFCNGTVWGYVIGAIVCIVAYFLEVFIDNCFARMKWQFAFKSAWIVAIVLGVVNVFVLQLMF